MPILNSRRLVTTQKHTQAYTKYIGVEFESCWAFIQRFYGNRLPDFAYLATDYFDKVTIPENDDLVIIHNGAHCGIYCDGAILHNVKNIGVIRQSANDFTSKAYYRLR